MWKLLVCFAASVCLVGAQALQPWRGTVMGYYRSADLMPVSAIDFSALTHIIHDHARPNTDGSLDLTSNGLTAQASKDLITAAHAAGVKVLLCIADTWPSGDFPGALNHQAILIANIITLVKTRGYDGVDIDWENNLNWTMMSSFIPDLKASLLAVNFNDILTVAAAPLGVAPQWASLVPDIDIVDCLSYELFWWGAQTTWHNSALYDGGALNAFGTPLYSADRIVNEYIAAGVPASKLAIGAAFYGHKITGVIGTPTGGPTGPRQNFEHIQPSDQPLLYNAIVALPEFQSATKQWDDVAQVSYLGVSDPINPLGDEFVSYDDPRSMAAKAYYARAKGLAGIFIWALPYDYFPANPVGQQHPLLQSIKVALLNLLNSPADITNGAWIKSGAGASAKAADTLQCASSGPTSLFQRVSVSANTTYTAQLTVQATGPTNGSLYLDIFASSWSSVLATQGKPLSGTAQTFTVTFNSGSNMNIIFSFDTRATAAGAQVKVTGISMNASE